MDKKPFVSLGSVRKVKVAGNTIDCVCQHGRVRLRVLAPGVLRVRATRQAKFERDFSYAIAKCNWPKTKTKITTGKSIVVTTGKLRVTISRQPFRIEFSTTDGTVLNRDQRLGWEGEKCRSYRELLPDERFFGCGEKTGQLNKRGQSFPFWNVDNPAHTYLNGEIYVSIPFLVSTRPGAHYGIFWDNTHRSFFNLGQTKDERSYVLEADAGEIDYYFFAGDSIKDVVRGYTDLTGRMWLPPRWALGFQQCRWSYMSAKEVLDVARNFRQRKIPCDVVYCDIDYMDGYRVFTWNPKTFPNPTKFVGKLAKQGFKLVTIIDPGVKNDDKYRVCRDGKQRGMFLKKPDGALFTGKVWPGECVFPDFTDPRVRKWWGPWHKALLDVGVAGIWNDMNEPAVWIEKLSTMPNDIAHRYDGQPTTHARAHNVYGFNMARACHDALRKLRPNDRPFVITRSAYAGIQRYSMVWTGDNHSAWEQYELSVRQCLNLGLSGVAFCGPDVGGFSWDCTGELLARWTQAGAFFPFFRNHSALNTRRQEPWTFGREVEEVCRKYISLRYRLLPYIYGLFREAARDGAPIMRPLFWEFPDDANGYAIDDQFLLGPSLLVAPVFRQGARQRAVYLPAGADWYDYWTKEKHAGGRYVSVPAPLDTLPLFVRAGTIIPTTRTIQHTGEPVREIILDVYPGNETVGSLYEDDGTSVAHESGKYSLTEFRWREGELTVLKRKTGYRSAVKRFRVSIAGK